MIRSLSSTPRDPAARSEFPLNRLGGKGQIADASWHSWDSVKRADPMDSVLFQCLRGMFVMRNEVNYCVRVSTGDRAVSPRFQDGL